MRFASVLPASLVAAALALFSAAPACAKLLITIDQSSQQMTVTVDGEVRYTWPVSTGRAGYGTPNGTFRPNRMEISHFSRVFDNAPMPHSIFFTQAGHAIHGSLEVRHLGSAASHGCVRLSPANATTLYALVKAEGMANTTVAIAGRIPAGPIIARRGGAEDDAGGYAPARIAPYDEQQGYGGQPAYDYAQPRSNFPPQPPPYYAQQRYGQPQPYYGQQPYGQPVYQQPQYYRQYNQY
jgi:L,D-transpeptidase-like protein